ncbi:tripartite tricarboxylate transporter substrate binding protein [Bordetella avium]|uniref:tripartite tricarboxylate transporter substrate binding protein n=1 Tax=Bordetella avium TaxID=521 RepID=UPI000E6A7895|nr:tripartite tricarboxylate transporter substrate binding protein [Bordetella avium]AZY53988.1 MFS transporter [Bordetella avium]RIQ70024.1 tripartite tricarboxylate transporter substrate binding protein [Bordetella avium]
MTIHSTLKRTLTLLVLGIATSCGAYAQSPAYPQKPIRLIVGFPAGGATDVAARLVGNKLSEIIGQAVIIENKPGSASNIGADTVAKAPADGYTLLFGTIALAVNGSLYPKLSYNPSKDFQPVAMVSSTPFILVSNPAAPYSDLKDLLDKARQSPREIYYATAGNGSGSHLFMEMFLKMAGVSMTHVPYRGAAPAMNDVLGNQVPLTFDNIMTTLPMVQAGKLKPLGVSTASRSKAAPDIPTLDDSGIHGFDASAWFGIFAPAGVPASVVSKLNQSLNAAVRDPQVNDKLLQMGADPVTASPEDFDTFFQNEVRKWKEVIDSANIKVE